MADTFDFVLNGRPAHVDGAAANQTLADWLRANGFTGTKQGCAEGDCGACTVGLFERDAAGASRLRGITSCITLVPMVAGREVVTVEGLGSPSQPHCVQRAMVASYGSQCGYCTPGFVVSMLEGFARDDVEKPADISDQLSGNLCRCTGYRPIRDAMQDALASPDRQTDGFRARLRGPVVTPPPLDYAASGQRFLRPATFAELLELRRAHKEAVLVAGATEVGVEVTKKARRFPLLISTEGVADLRAIETTDDAWRVGGAATLTDLEDAVRGKSPAIEKMLSVFASRQIRNRATLAGNLVTASPIGDMAPVLLAMQARVVLASTGGERELPLDDFFVAYRKTALAADELLKTIVIPRRAPDGLVRRLDSFKVSKRRELDIAIVAAGFCVDQDAQGVVVSARLAYGGVAATPIRAKRAEAALVGRPFGRESVDAALPLLAEELTPIDDARGSAAYRRGLIGSLLEKFLDGAKSEAQDLPLGFARGAALDLAPPSKCLPHESGLGHVTGRAEYVDDAAQKRPMLDVWPVASPHAHARIARRDATRARSAPGVVAVLMAEDIPGENDVGAVKKDEVLLADREVLYHGHLVAIVVGTSIEVCRAAAALVEVDYEPLPAIVGLDAAIAAESFHTEPHAIQRGDCKEALAASPHRLRGETRTGGQEHFYLETQAAWAERGDDGDIQVTSSTQHPSEIQAVVSHVLHLPRHKVVVTSPRMGGGFGGKETQGNTFAALVALAAWRTGRPVRLMLDRDVDMQLTGKRHPFLARWEAGFDDHGRLRALEARLVSDGGWSLDLSQSILDRALFHLDNAYHIPNVDFSGRVARTNVASNTAFRGFGGPQGMHVIEDVLGRIARRLGLTGEAVRERNMYHGVGETATTHYGQSIEDNRLPKIWRRLKETSRLDDRRAEVERWNRESPRVKRGLAITPVKFGISFTASFLNQSGALVHVYRDGSIQVAHGGTEMGQGLYTKVQGVAMRELGLPAELVRVMRTCTDKVPNTSATAASAGADLNGAAVREACRTLRERLAPIAWKLLSARGVATDPAAIVFQDGHVHAPIAPHVRIPFPEVAEAAYFARVALSATGFYATPSLGYDRERGRGRPFYYFAFGAAVSEVEVDGYTGMKRVRRVDILHDVGDSLNPGIDRGQVEGGFVQGMGWLTGEELVWDAKGVLKTHSASTYQIPSIGDAPADFRVELLPDAAQQGTIHGSKAVGEPPLMLALSVRAALEDAVAAFGPPGGDVALASPATHEALFCAIQARLAAAPREATAARTG